MFFLLRLKPLVDSECAVPPVLVFPSYERILAKKDPITQGFINNFISGILSNILRTPLASINDVTDFATSNGEEFLDAVQRANLFIAPGGPVGEPLEAAIERYRREVTSWRSTEHIEQLAGLSKSQFVCNAILERLEPQYHLAENANELRAQPLLSVEQQEYYFKLCVSANDDMLETQDAISPVTRATVNALSQRKFEWLSQRDMDALVAMRLNNENEHFREHLSKAASILNEADLSDLDRVASEVSKGIGTLLNQHTSEARRIEEKYKSKYRRLAASGWLSVGTLLVPHLAPLIAAIPGLTFGGQYVKAKMEELRERRELSRSLIGILASARNQPYKKSEWRR